VTNEAFERLACAGDGIAIERLECGTSLDKRPIRRGPHVDRDIQLARLRAFDRCDEPVPCPISVLMYDAPSFWLPSVFRRLLMACVMLLSLTATSRQPASLSAFLATMCPGFDANRRRSSR